MHFRCTRIWAEALTQLEIVEPTGECNAGGAITERMRLEGYDVAPTIGAIELVDVGIREILHDYSFSAKARF